MKRSFDIFFGLIFLFIFIIPFILISILIKIDSSGPIFFYSKRIGRNNKIFYMPKFRTMKINTPNLASDKLKNPNRYLTKVGIILRKYSLDETPQILSILLGKMSLVGPRPALFNQYTLINKRKKLKISILRPGLTGLAQINGRDSISLKKKIFYDYEYLKNNNLYYDLKILTKTILVVLKRKDISH